MPLYGSALPSLFYGIEQARLQQQQLAEYQRTQREREALQAAQSDAGSAMQQAFQQLPQAPPPGAPSMPAQQPASPGPPQPQIPPALAYFGAQGGSPLPLSGNILSTTLPQLPPGLVTDPKAMLARVLADPRIDPRQKRSFIEQLNTQGQPQIPPYRDPSQAAGAAQPMQGMQPSMQAGGIAAPPAEGQGGGVLPRRELSMDAAARFLAAKGLSGLQFFRAMNAMAPMMNAEAKQQLAEVNQQLRASQAETQRLREMEQERHNKAMEPSAIAQRGARTGEAEARAELDRARTAAGGYAPTRAGAAGGLPKAPSGFRWTDTGELEFIPGGPHDPKIKGSGAMAQRFTGRVVSDAAEATQSLDNIASFPFETGAIFGGTDKHEGLFAGGLKQYLAKQLTSESAMRLDVIQTGLSRAISMAVNMGLAPTDVESAQFERFYIKPGDTVGVAQLKIANQAQIVRNALKGLDPRNMSEEQKSAVDAMRKKLSGIPEVKALQGQYYSGTNKPPLMQTPAKKREGGTFTPAEEGNWKDM